VEEENRRYDTDHCVVGYLVAHAWSLPAAVGEAIWFHHEPGLEMHTDPLCRTLKAVLLLADYLCSGAVDEEIFWADEHQAVLAELDLDVEAVKDLEEEVQIALGIS
jgi:HD-like signal output (HDOD) protein